MGQKLSSKLLFISSPNTDRFYRFHISQAIVAMQLRCSGEFSNHFIANFPQNAPVKKYWKSVSVWQRYGQKFVAYFSLDHPVYNWLSCESFCYNAVEYLARAIWCRKNVQSVLSRSDSMSKRLDVSTQFFHHSVDGPCHCYLLRTSRRFEIPTGITTGGG